MKPSAELHELIQNMSRSEKRFFRIFSERHGGKGRYLRIFDQMTAMPEYDESRFQDRTRFFPMQKNYLQEAVLDSLSVYHRDKTYLARHSKLLTQIEVLYKRGLFRHCMRQIRKAKKSAYVQELYAFLLMFVRWETIIHIKNEDEENVMKNLDEEIRLNEILRVQYALMQIAFRVQIRMEKGNPPKEYLRMEKQLLKKHFPIPPFLNSFWASYYYHSTRGLLATAESEHDIRFDSFASIKRIMEEAPVFIRDLPGIYHLNMNNLINVMFRLEKYPEAGIMLQEQRQFMDKYGIRNVTLGKIMFLNTTENELFLHYKTGEIQPGMYFLHSIDSAIRSTPVSFSPLVFDVLFMMAVVAFTGNDLRSAARYLNRIINEEKIGKIRPELSITTRLLYLVVLFESGDLLFESRFQATRRLLKRYPQFGYYDRFLEVLNLLHEGRREEKIFHEKVRTLRKESGLFTSDESNKQFDFMEWLARQIK